MVDRSVDWVLRRAIEKSGDGLWIFDPEGRTLWTNQRAAELLGRSRDELARLSVLDVLDDVGREQFRAHLRELREHGVNQRDVECGYRCPDGRIARLLVGESEIRDDDGSLVGYAHRLVDSSSQNAMLEEISRGRAQLADAQSIARLGSWEIDYRTDTATWSPQIYEILGLDPETTVPNIATFFAMLHDSDRPAVEEEYATAKRVPGQRDVDARIVLPDGSTRWVRVLGRALEWGPDGAPLRVGGTVQDIDEAKETELRLRDAVVLNTLMQFMATAANEATTLREAMVTLQALLLAHEDWCAAVAYEVRGRRELVPVHVIEEDSHTDLEHAVALRALEAGDVVFEEEAVPQNPMISFPVTLGDRTLIVAVVTACSPFERQPMLRTMARQISAQLATVAAREAVALELEAARDHAMEASRAKSEFVATMSHEIRTPLNGVIGLNDLLLRTHLDEHQRRLAEGMQGAGHALLKLINDILDFSKIEAGALDLERVPFNPRDVVGDLLGLFRPQATARGNQLAASFDDALPAVLVGDPGRFRQVLSNLISNAVKFTSGGRVSLSVTASPTAHGVQLRVEVADTGIGMTEEQLEHVFDPFRQADASTTRDYGGTGLGLTIARQLAAALDGELGASSGPGEGSTFWFTGHFEASRETAPAPVPSPHLQPSGAAGHVLVVEDNDTNQLVALGMLEALGYTADVASDGAEGAARALTGGYDAVLMDLQMPGTDGFEGTRLIRDGLPAGQRLPIIALTASATDGARERCLAAGMDGFLTKPLSIERLDEELRAHLGTPTADRPTSRSRVRSAVEPAGTARRQPAGFEADRLTELAEMGEEAAPLIRRAVENFVRRAADELTAIGAAVEDGDHEAVRMTAHRLKGSAANLGLVEIADLAFALEELGGGATVDRCVAADLLGRLGTALDAGIASLAQHPVVAWCRARSASGATPD
ncbi:MAG TPA: ATP-binding protein [Marmoricola sp.]|nr:ATP-binding protein [Marmoricola sp.]